MNEIAPTTVPAETKLEKVTLPAGTVVFRQGEKGDAAYILDKGKIVIYQQVESQRVELDSIKPGEIFGEMAVIDSSQRMATAMAAVESVVTRIPEPLFAQRLQGTDKFVRALVSMFIKNIRTSHRIFVRRPRSFRDNIKLIRHFAFNIERYANLLEDQMVGNEMRLGLKKLEDAVAELAAIGAYAKDKRHDHIVEDGEHAEINLRAVVGTEGRRPADG